MHKSFFPNLVIHKNFSRSHMHLHVHYNQQIQIHGFTNFCSASIQFQSNPLFSLLLSFSPLSSYGPSLSSPPHHSACHHPALPMALTRLLSPIAPMFATVRTISLSPTSLSPCMRIKHKKASFRLRHEKNSFEHCPIITNDF